MRTVTSPDEELRTLPTPTEDLASKGARETCKTNGYFERKFWRHPILYLSIEPRHKDKQTGASGHVSTDLDHWSKKFLTLPVSLSFQGWGVGHMYNGLLLQPAKQPGDEAGGVRCDHSVRLQMEIYHPQQNMKWKCESCDCLVWSWRGHQKNLLLPFPPSQILTLHDRTNVHRDLGPQPDITFLIQTGSCPMWH